MYGVFFVLFGLLFFQELNALQTSQENDLKVGPFNNNPSNGRRMIRGKKPRYYSEENPQFKTMDNSDQDRSDRNEANDKPLQEVIAAIDSGVKTFMASENKTAIIGNIAKAFLGLVKENGQKSSFRSKTEEYIKPEIIHFRNNPEDQPTVMLQLNSQTITSGLQDLLQSSLVQKLMQHYSKEAAMVYRSVKNQLDKKPRYKN